MKNQSRIGRRELFRRLAAPAGAAALAAAMPGSTAAFAENPATSPGNATVRVILADATTVQWLAVTDGGMTVGGATPIASGPPGLNANIVRAAIAAIAAADGPQLPWQNVTLLGGKS